MKAKEVMELLRISRSTLNRLRWENKIEVNKLPNGYYDYDEKSVYEYLLKTTGKPVPGGDSGLLLRLQLRKRRE